MLTPVGLRVENTVNPLGLDEPRPRFSWRLEGDGLVQRAYRLVLSDAADASQSLWDTGIVRSNAMLGIEYGGPTLLPRTRYWWRVQVSDGDAAPGPWSEPAWFEMGLLEDDWNGQWIGGVAPTPGEPRLERVGRIWSADADARGARFRHSFDVPAGALVSAARVAGGTGGEVALSINGRAIGVGEDVAGALIFGSNVIEVSASAADSLPGGLALRLQITCADRAPIMVDTDDAWQVSTDGQAWTMAVRLGRYGDPPWGRVPATVRPSPLLRTSFSINKAVRRARLYATALGVYEAWLNGRRIGDDVLMPGWTDYPTRVPYQAYDVTDLLREGDNALGAVLGEGWYTGYLGFIGPLRYGTQPLFLGQLEIEHTDGSRTLVASDASWRCSSGETVYSDQLMGETIDARLRQDGWSTPPFDASAWQPVSVHEPRTHVEAEVAPRMAVHMDLPALTVNEPTPGSFVFDLGQNMVGWIRLRVAGGSRGQKVIVRFAEVLNPDGTLYTANLRSAQNTDEFIVRGDGDEVFEPRFTHHGFRYVEVSGYPGQPSLDVVSGRVVYARMPLSGTFECSNELINKLQQNIQWGQRGNFLSVPTDCPQRDERLGWTGDAQVFAATAAYNMDVQQFLTKWLIDVTDAQLPNGAITHFAPMPPEAPRHSTGGAAGWADAVVIVPWTLYWVYGDVRVLERCYLACTAWIDFMERQSRDNGLIRPDEGFGDWLSIDADTPKDLIGTAYFAYSARLVSQMARVLGKAADAERYAALSDRVRAAFRKRFVRGGGRVFGETQTAYILALFTDMLEPEERPLAAEHLVRDIAYRNGHLSTGFLGTPWLMPVLTQVGRMDVAFALLLQDTQPSWLFPVKNGATTMWERWDSWSVGKGFLSPSTTQGHVTRNMNSFNHYAYGCVGDWLYRVVAGIECLAPGYERVRIRPRPGGNLEWVRASYESVRGTIGCEWRMDGDRLRLKVKIPPNTVGEVWLSDDEQTEVGAGEHEFVIESKRFALAGRA